MTRDRPFRRIESASSVEAELGPTCFEFLLERFNRPGKLRVLDLGCGTGRALQRLIAGWPQHQFIGIDLNPGPNVPTALKADARHLPVASHCVDIVLATQLLQYLPDKLAFLGDVFRVLRMGGMAAFAMTEHFDDESGFDPPLPRLLAFTTPRETIRAYKSRSVGGRRVVSFAMFRRSNQVSFDCEFVRAIASRIQEDPFPYLQSCYRAGLSLSEHRRNRANGAIERKKNQIRAI